MPPMLLHKYVVTYHPFPESDLTSTMTRYGTEPEDVRMQFAQNFPMWNIVSITEVEGG